MRSRPCFLDTSAVVKLYVEEDQSQLVAAILEAAPRVAIARIAHPEARSAFARRAREGAISPRVLRSVVRALEADLGSFVVVELSPEVAARAGELAERHALRAYDAIQLSSALTFAVLVRPAPLFLSFDTRLNAAAVAEGLGLP